VAIAFDETDTGFRIEIDPTYKANRGETPPELAVQWPIALQLLDALVELALTPFPGAPPDLAEAIQSEAVLTLTAGVRAIFPWHVAQLAMLHTCVLRVEAASPAGTGLGPAASPSGIGAALAAPIV